MNPGVLELLLVAGVVAVAGGYVAIRVLGALRGKEPGGCAGSACPATTRLLADVRRAARDP